MAKREADHQLTQLNVHEMDNSNMGDGNMFGSATRAGAQTMAKRQIARPRTRRPGQARPGIGATSASLLQQQNASTQQSTPQQSFPTFGQSSQGSVNFGQPQQNSFQQPPQNTFSFGQSSTNNTQNPTSQSFPPFGGLNSQNNSVLNNQFNPPSGAFSFNATPTVSNPFTQTNAQQVQEQPKPSSSIFNWPPTAPQQNGASFPSQQSSTSQEQQAQSPIAQALQQVKETNPNNLFASMTGNGPKPNPFAALVQPRVAENQSDQNGSNLFAGAQSSQKTQAQTQENTPQQGLFQGLQVLAPEGSQTQADNKQNSTANLYAPAQPAETAQTPGKANPFAASIAQFQASQQKQPNSTSTSDSAPSSTKAASASSEAGAATTAQHQPSLFPTDTMPTSPDAASQKAPQAQSTPFQFSQAPSNQFEGKASAKTNTLTSGSNLFGNLSQPFQASSENANSTSGMGMKQPASGSLLEKVTKPISNKSPKSDVPGEGADQSAPTSLFERVSSPVTQVREAPIQDGVVGKDQPQPARPRLFDRVTFPEAQSNGAGSSHQTTPLNADQPARPGVFDSTSRPNDDFSVIKRADNQTNTDPTNTTASKAVDTVPKPQPWFTADERLQVYVGWRLKQLDEGLHAFIEQKPNAVDLALTKRFYEHSKALIIAAGEGAVPSVLGQKRAAGLLPDTGENQPSAKRVTVPGSQSSAPALFMGDRQSQATGSPRASHQPSLNSNGKRNADNDTPAESSEPDTGPSKRARGGEPTPTSQTSNLFSSILDSKKEATPSAAQSAKDGVVTSSAAFPPSLFQSQASLTKNPFGSSIGNFAGSSLFQPAKSAAANLHESSSASSNKAQPLASAQTNQSGPHAKQSTGMDAPSTNAFAFKPASTHAQSTTLLGTPDLSAVKPPSFGTSASMNFVSQFGDAAKKEAEQAQKKRKADDYDSDEEDEASWEQKDAEAQKQKKQRIEEAAKNAQQFRPESNSTPKLTDIDFNSVPEKTNVNYKSAPEKTDSSSSATATKPAVPKSIFDMQSPLFTKDHGNIFGHLAKSASGPDADKSDDQSDEDENEGEIRVSTANHVSSSVQPAGKSLFDRISRPEDPTLDDKASSEASPSGDHTWKADSPIKFGAPANNSAIQNGTAETSSKPSATGLFGAAVQTSVTETPASKSAANPFSDHNPSGGAIGFGFAPAKSAANTLAPPSKDTSRATSPGITTGESATESAAEGPEDVVEKHEQIDLMSKRVGEEEEEVLLEIRAKALQYEHPDYNSKGVGPLRILKHRQTGARRVVLRVEPSGKVLINSRINTRYLQNGSTVQGNFSDASGTLQMWRIKVKTKDDAGELLEVLKGGSKDIHTACVA